MEAFELFFDQLMKTPLTCFVSSLEDRVKSFVSMEVLVYVVVS